MTQSDVVVVVVTGVVEAIVVVVVVVLVVVKPFYRVSEQYHRQIFTKNKQKIISHF